MKSRFWRLNNLYWIVDEDKETVKYHMNRIQYILYNAFWWLNIVLKSRQHGITTFVCLLFLDACLFTPNMRAGIIAHKLADAKKIFHDKIKYAYEHLPENVKAMTGLEKDDAQEYIFTNNSGIYAATTMHSATLNLLLVTEYGWLCAHAPQRALEVKNAMETVHKHGFVVIESTAEDVGDDFQLICDRAQKKQESGTPLTRMDYRFHFFPWFLKESNQLFESVAISDEFLAYFNKIEMQTGHKIGPTYRGWYVKKKEVLAEKMYTQHPSTPEEAFFASSEGSYFARYMIRAMEDKRICDLPWEKPAPVHVIWDLGDMHTAFWFWQLIGDWIHCIDFYYDNEGLDLADYKKVLDTKPYIYGDHFIGPDIVGSNRKKRGRIMMDYAAELGIDFRPVETHSREERHESIRMILNKCKFDKRKCEFGIRAMMKYKKERNELASTEEMTVFKNIPFHDWASHGADAFGHGAIAYWCENIGGTIMGKRGKKRKQPANQADMGVTNLIEV